MKILAFTDLHGDLKRLGHLMNLIKLKKPDLLICAGDISWFGAKINPVMKKLDSINIPILIIPGNHESEEEIEDLAKKHKNLIDINKKIVEINNFQFFGFGSGGFSQKNIEFEKQFEKIKSKIKDNNKFIFVSHQPPYQTNLDKIQDEHVGSKSIRKFIEFTNPILVISGHIHESEHSEDKIKKSRLINPGSGEFITL